MAATLTKKEQEHLKMKYGPMALVTGATSGIGLAIAQQLAQCGLDLVITARTTSALERLKNQLESTHGITVIALTADLSNEQSTDAFIKSIHAYHIGLAVLCAGYGTSGLFMQSKLDEEINMLRLNCEAVLKLSHYFTKVFRAWKKGGIIFFSSIVAYQGVPHAAHYAATKAYIQSLAEALAIELKPYDVDILVAAPGPVKTGFEQRANLQMNGAMLPETIAVPVLKALGRKSSVWPGFLSKLLIVSLHTLPRFLKIRIMQKIMGGMTKHQRTTAF